MRASVIFVLAIIAGCTRLPPLATAPATDNLAAQHAARTKALTHFRLTSRIAVQRGDQGMSADLDWTQADQSFDLRVSAPLGRGSFRLAGDATHVIFDGPRGEHHEAADAETLMQTQLGWALPVRGARYWVRGIPSPASVATQALRDERGRYSDFAQDGWRISIGEYMQSGGYDLPRKLFLSRGELKVKLAIKNWLLTP
jgi:outer membrane lipoprotein LolB